MSMTLSAWAEASLPINVQLRLRRRAASIAARVSVEGDGPTGPWKIAISTPNPLVESGHIVSFRDHPDGDLATLIDQHLTELGAES